MGKLDDKVAAVTGGTRGIGRAIADAILAEGGKVVVNGRSAEKGQQALDEMGVGDRAVFVQGDVLQREECERLVDTAVSLSTRRLSASSSARWATSTSRKPPSPFA